MKRLIALVVAVAFVVPAYAQQPASPSETEIAVMRVQIEHVRRAFAEETQQQLRIQAAGYEARLQTAMEWLKQAQAKEQK